MSQRRSEQKEGEDRVAILVHSSGKVLRFSSREEAEHFLEVTKDNERDEWILEAEENSDAAPSGQASHICAAQGGERKVMVYLTRKIEFSASHLYHNPALSAEENRRIFGKCNNPHGHGHNYTLEVTVAGEPDPVTGMVLDLKELKEILEREITQKMDHRFLNYEVPELKGQIPTCENVAKVIWNLLEPKITQGRLHKVRLYESPDLYAECYRNGASRA